MEVCANELGLKPFFNGFAAIYDYDYDYEEEEDFPGR